ncbi:alternative ribosome rescue aminoacyl-tRNA hydrolase ArfB [Aliikangiella sp. IMCC44653]
MIKISESVSIPLNEVSFDAIRAQGAGGQNVNKVSSAIHLRFDIAESSLPEFYKQRLLTTNDTRVSKDGVVIIKAQQFRTQEKNRNDAINRLIDFIQQSTKVLPPRRATKPSKNSQTKRMDRKTKHSQKKSLRGKVSD